MKRARNDRALSATSCRIFISDARHYNMNELCPLRYIEVFNKGIEIGVRAGGVCEYSVAEISGVVAKNQNGSISLD